jgi:hypothetical protein
VAYDMPHFIPSRGEEEKWSSAKYLFNTDNISFGACKKTTENKVLENKRDFV